MSVGFPVSKAGIDDVAGNLALNLQRNLDSIRQFKAWLDNKTPVELQGYGYSEEEAVLLKDSFTDLDALAQVASGQRAQGQANNFFWNAKNLTGIPR
jgi:hypothetical protein